MERLRVRIPGLTCASCVPHIEQVMRQQEGVIWAIVNFAAGGATIFYDPAVFSESRLRQAVDLLGFEIVPDGEPDLRPHAIIVDFKPLARMHKWVQGLHH